MTIKNKPLPEDDKPKSEVPEENDAFDIFTFSSEGLGKMQQECSFLPTKFIYNKGSITSGNIRCLASSPKIWLNEPTSRFVPSRILVEKWYYWHKPKKTFKYKVKDVNFPGKDLYVTSSCIFQVYYIENYGLIKERMRLCLAGNPEISHYPYTDLQWLSTLPLIFNRDILKCHCYCTALFNIGSLLTKSWYITKKLKIKHTITDEEEAELDRRFSALNAALKDSKNGMD